jgi:hypothetical protein
LARWKLAISHYLNTVKPVKWRYQETERSTGENLEREYIVPRLLDINDPRCWTNRLVAGANVGGSSTNIGAEGEVVVCTPGKGQPGDIEFLGDPTPDMIPMDEDAEAISASFQDHWAYKPDGVEPNYSQSIVDRHGEVEARASEVKVAGLDQLVAAMEVQSHLMADLIANQTHTPVRRV